MRVGRLIIQASLFTLLLTKSVVFRPCLYNASSFGIVIDTTIAYITKRQKLTYFTEIDEISVTRNLAKHIDVQFPTAVSDVPVGVGVWSLGKRIR